MWLLLASYINLFWSIIYKNFFFFGWIFLEASYNKTMIRNDENKSMLFISQCFISFKVTKSLPGQFICLKMPLKFRKMGFNLYFYTFNSFSSNVTYTGSSLWVFCKNSSVVLKLFLISATFPLVSFAASGRESKEDYLVKLLFISESGTLFRL